jgi:hypothetical protein
MIVGFNLNQLISILHVVNLYDSFTIYSQSLKGLTWKKYKSSYILGQRE